MFQKPYIGVTDFTTREQVLQAKRWVNKESMRRLHVGAMISRKTHLGLPTKLGWEKVWLQPDGLKKLFVKDDEVFNVLHYAAYHGDGKLTTLKDLLQVCEKAGNGLDGLQLDMLWPDEEMVKGLKKTRPELSLILQVSYDAIEDSKNRNSTFMKDLEAYGSVLDYILLDAGMGQGKEFKADMMLELVRQATKLYDMRQIAVGGGLGPLTYRKLGSLLKEFPLISWDAQGRLRLTRNPLDPLDMLLVKDYLKRSSGFSIRYL